MRLSFAPRFRTCKVITVRNGSPLTYRLMELGLIEGAQVEVMGAAPLGDPLQIRCGDSRLSLRREEAELIDVA